LKDSAAGRARSNRSKAYLALKACDSAGGKMSNVLSNTANAIN
jgi:hypothetical protein